MPDALAASFFPSARIGLVVLAASTALACAGVGAAPRNPLDLSAAGEDVAAIGARFASQTSARYGIAPEADVVSDLVRAGFDCRQIPPVEARTDYLVASCDRPLPRGRCIDRFIVDLRRAEGEGAMSVRVRPDGRFTRDCVVPRAR